MGLVQFVAGLGVREVKGWLGIEGCQVGAITGGGGQLLENS